LYKPTNFDPSRKYPVLNHFIPAHNQAVWVAAASGHPGVINRPLLNWAYRHEVDANGNTGTLKSFHDAYYGNMGDNGLPDQVEAIKQLGAPASMDGS
jgi:hypothetical protein